MHGKVEFLGHHQGAFAEIFAVGGFLEVADLPLNRAVHPFYRLTFEKKTSPKKVFPEKKI